MSLPELEVKCWQCWGIGVIPSENHADMVVCSECNGLGWIPTEDGRRLLDFLDRHFLSESKKKTMISLFEPVCSAGE